MRGAGALLAVTCLGFAILGGLAAAGDHGTAPAPPAPRFAEPDALTIPNGVYLGYVRAVDGPDAQVAVDLVSLTDGAVGNVHPEVFVDAGPLATIGLFRATPDLFRITIRDGAIVGAHSPGDVLPP